MKNAKNTADWQVYNNIIAPTLLLLAKNLACLYMVCSGRPKNDKQYKSESHVL